MNADQILDYDELVATYTTNLDVTLRGFRPAAEMLDTWVPDDDLVRSVMSLVEAAQLCGSDAVSMRIARKTFATETPESVGAKLRTLGEVSQTNEKDSVVFTVSKLQETAAFRSVRPIYQEKLRERSSNLRFRRALKTDANQISLRATEGPSSLSWSVSPEKHIITDAAFESTASGPILAALDILCETLVGLPVLEAREHAIIRLEFALRTANQKHPVTGIVLPQNADSLFRLPSNLVNRLFDDYRTSTQYIPGANVFDPGPKAEWRMLPAEEREKRLSNAVNEATSSLGTQIGDVEVVECKFPYAVTVKFADRLTIPSKRQLALNLERLFRQKCDPRLEVFCEEKKDLSKLRRLTEKE